MKILLVVVVSLLLIAGGITAAVVKLRRSLLAPPPPVSVRVETVTRGELIEIISAPGEVQPNEKVSISAKVAAPIVSLPFQEGDHVTKGAVLVKLDARDLEAALHSAVARLHAQEAQLEVSIQRISASQSTIDSAQANLKDAQRDLDRQKGLLGTNDVSQSIVDTAQTKYDAMMAQIASTRFSLEADKANLKVQHAQLDAAKSDVKKAEDDLSYTTIASTIEGVVTRRKAEVGEMVVPGIQGSPGTTIMEVADLSKMVMVARVDEASVMRVAKEQHAKVRMQAFAEDVFDGSVERVANARADDSSSSRATAAASGDGSRYFECRIRLDTRGKPVSSGLSADADIEVRRHTGLKIPSQAVLGRPIDTLPADARSKPEVDATKSVATVVYRLINGKTVCTPVTVGPSDETRTLIQSGLKDGDQIIVGPYKELEALTDGQAVKVEAAVTKPGA